MCQSLTVNSYQEEFFSRRRLIFTAHQVIFECNSMSCFETIRADFEWSRRTHTPMLGNTYSIELNTNIWQFDMYINKYTRRSLRNQSDILKAVRGLLRSYATKKNAYQQHWGIFVTHTAYWERTLRDFSQAQQVSLAFSSGLCWYVGTKASPDALTVRRPGFPSWSWAGWIAAVVWGRNDPKCDAEMRVRPQYYVQKKDGSNEVLTEALAARIFLNTECVASRYTYNLYVVAEIIDLRLTYLTDLTEYSAYRHVRTNEPEGSKCPSFAVKIDTALPETEESLVYYWHLMVTPHVEEGDEMYESLCNEVVHCVVLSDCWGLVVQKRGDVFERVGLFELWCANTDKPGIRLSHLSEHFKGSTREILLG